ncbi:DNA-directed RNA polymerase specialized sigma24 family protein [Lipingzhangella halophila]|uniref:DNA-directed RNA polymerase specialized sigma24 family protein n=1 Tax=Lipingzhangella halophila TaxID=1783352 RepID=A0A7W7W434_9ACTN|nr:sigma factor [Lipingzhangella halophila]MBB4933672.1 DNA-directed RNA polymerase specialized sigma24 family protein [Lipingzhangella halophila]
MATDPDGGPQPARAGAGLVAQLRQGEGYERLYNAYASQLYRYCWSLVGTDVASEAVYEAVLAAVQLLDQLDDHSDLRTWLFALARSACQRRGFSSETPYAQLATEPAERPVVEMALRLPPSHSELLELYLRHNLAPSQIARIHGLDPEITSELCRAAVRRAANVCAEFPEDDTGVDHHIRADHSSVSEVLALLEPPAPPEELRERTIHACADPAMAEERARIGATMTPMGADGFPLHRDRSELPGEGHDHELTSTAPTASADGGEETAIAASAPATAADAPTGTGGTTESEQASGPTQADGTQSRKGGRRRGHHRARRYRWPVSATSGLATVGVALALWGAALLAAGDPEETNSSDPPNYANQQPAAEGTGNPSTPPGDAPPEGGANSAPPGQEGDAGNAPGEPGRENASSPDPDNSASAAPDASAQEPSESPDAAAGEEPGEADAAGSEDESSDDDSEDAESEDDSEAAKGPISRLFDGLLNPDG